MPKDKNKILQLIFIILFVLVLLVPNILLSANTSLSLGAKIINIILPLSIYISFLCFSRKAGRSMLLLLPLLIVNMYQIFLIILFGPFVVGTDMILNIFTSDTSEAMELLYTLMPTIIIGLCLFILIVVLIVHSFKNKYVLSLRRRKKIFVIGLTFFSLSCPLIYIQKIKYPQYEILTSVYPFNFFYNCYLAAKESHDVETYQERMKNFSFSAQSLRNKNEKELYVLLIGETSRAMNWQLYGYQKPTTPKLYNMRDSLLVFTDVFTQSNTTHKSVPIILSNADADHSYLLKDTKSFISAFKEAGFNTACITNQPANRSYTDLFTSEADCFRSIRNRFSGQSLDENMLPIVDSIISLDNTKQLIVIHSYGSHYNYADRYPQSMCKFTNKKATRVHKSQRDILENSYNNTILYTDELIYKLINKIKATNRDAVMLYLADHGEDILDDKRQRFLHATPDISTYQICIPFIMYASKEYKASYPNIMNTLRYNLDKPFSSNIVFYTMLSLAGINVKDFDKHRSLCFPLPARENKEIRRYLDDHNHSQPIWSMSQSPIIDSLAYAHYRSQIPR